MFAHLLAAIGTAPLYRAAIFFYGFYPISMALVWVIMAVIYFLRREHQSAGLAPSDFEPFVSVIIPTYDEEHTIVRTIKAVLDINYPDFEVVVVNDGSSDDTLAALQPYVGSGRVRLVDKLLNEGKAMALNDAVPACGGEILVFIDSDVIPTSTLIHSMVQHFLSPRVGAVTGNPRVANRGSLLRDLQTLEFTSIISVQRRAQRIWGRVLTMSGAVMAIRKTALIEAGGFTASMATEDIDLTWKLQRLFWDVRYEPSAIVWMQVPPTIRELWKQRRRWARGLAQVLRRHATCVFKWRQRRMWPVFIEATLSILWAYTFLLMTAYWVLCELSRVSGASASPVPATWGMLVATACLTQLLAGALMDRRYDPHLLRYFPVAIFYPLVYWSLMSIITSIYTVDGFVRKPPQVQRWKIKRVPGAKRPLVIAFMLAFAASTRVFAQSPQDELERAAQAAREDRHADAIAAYEHALALDPTLRTQVLAPLGRQYLWSDQPAHAATLLAEYLKSAHDCDVHNDYGLALAWSNQLSKAQHVYDVVIKTCPQIAATARLREAVVRRWQDRPTAAARLYHEVINTGSRDEIAAARVGLGYVGLLQDYNRRALQIFRETLADDSARSQWPDARAGTATAFYRLGRLDSARAAVRRLGADSLPRDMRDLLENIAARDRVQMEPVVQSFHDADGTRRTLSEDAITRGWALRGRGGIGVQHWRLANETAALKGTAFIARAEQRWSPALGTSAQLAYTDIGAVAWRPVTGEVDVVLTPGDRLRIDAAAARLTVTDYIPAVQQHLAGSFISLGSDFRVTSGLTLSASTDRTIWSTENHRTRLRADVRWQLEGTPRITFELPALFQHYDNPMPFPYFSPLEYTEAGPAVNLYQRFARVWNVSAYGRTGKQRENSASWNTFGTIRLSVWRDLVRRWSARGDFGWSNSNLASPNSFQRTSFQLSAVRQLAR